MHHGVDDRMVGTVVLHQSHLMTLEADLPRCPEQDFSLKEQECISLMKKCNNMQEFKQVHGQVLKLGMFCNPFCASNLLATCALSGWGSMDYACSIFRHIENPGSFEFNTIIRGYVKSMNSEEALSMYIKMLEEEVHSDNFTYPPLLKACALLSAIAEGSQIHGHIVKLGIDDDVFVQNSLINVYGKCKKIQHCCRVFEQMDHLNTASWSALIAAHVNMGMWCECLRIFRDMNWEMCWRAEESTLVSVLTACAHIGAVDIGKCIHGYLLRNFRGINVTVETSLMDMYIKSGCLDKGLSLFQRMQTKNQMSYSVIISGLALHGRGQEALEVFKEMLDEGLKPDDVVYVSVLTACSHSGLVKEGREFFNQMSCQHGIEPTLRHYGCMVDLLGRAGMFDEASEFIKSMPVEPNDVVWRSVLTSSKIHENLECGEVAFRKLRQLKKLNASDYVMLSNMYAKAQRWNDVALIRTKMAQERVAQVPGCCQVEVNGKVHKFVSHDNSHSPNSCVYEMLHQMEWQLRFEGYKPDTSQVLFDVEEEEKRQRLSVHSQKLAIAFALVHTTQGSPVRILRNVRMCSDCHTYTKLISTIYEREIIVRDRNRFHHFTDGSCSCKDYW